MSAENLFILIVVIVVADFFLERLLEYLNIKNMSSILPESLKGIYNKDKYRKFQLYKKDGDKLVLLTSTLSFGLILFMLFFNGFAYLDTFISSRFDNSIFISLLFFGVLIFASKIIGMPFSYYSTFFIEERFGFNKTSLKTFILDKIKGWFIGVIIGGGLLIGFIYLYSVFESSFWYFAWIGISFFTFIMTTFYSNIIVPLFNKQKPLEGGDLREAIEKYAESVDFKLDNIYVIDGSKRSTKANAYFTGLGKKKRIVLYDTLIHDLEIEEIVAVLAHEVGHYKKKHTLLGFLSSIISTGIILYIFSLIVNNPLICEALGVSKPSIHISLIFFSMMLTPVNLILSVFMNIWSRYNEYQADNFARKTCEGSKLISALKKISVNALSNLTPHPLYEFIYYSHPSLLKRIKNIL